MPPTTSHQQQQQQQQQRTIQVKIGNQAARAMTPDQAAEYLKSIAGRTGSSALGAAMGGHRELKMTFENGATSTVALPRSNGDHHHRTTTTTTTATNTSGTTTTATTRADGMPCSEKEMKALMSMFVEIMGLQMNTERLNASTSCSTKTTNTPHLFRYPDDVPHPPPPGGWPTGLPAVPPLEEIPPEERNGVARAQQQQATKLRNRSPTTTTVTPVPIPTPPPVTGAAGIATVQWYALERAAIEDALEQEERMRRHQQNSSSDGTTTNNASSLPSHSNNTTAANKQLLQAEAASSTKKWRKTVAAWRTKVGAAVAQNDTDLLQTILTTEAPTDPPPSSSTTTSVWEPLVPLCVASKHAAANTNAPARSVLAQHILQATANDTSLFFTIHRADGRSAVHAACLYADVPLLRLILQTARTTLAAAQLRRRLLERCQDSGWTPLHYAALSGSIRTVETIFAVLADDADEGIPLLCQAETHPAQTWKKGRHHGATPTELAEAMLSGKTDKLVETHGIALSMIAEHYKVSLTSGGAATPSAPRMNLYLYLTGFLYCRILATETSGYTAMTEVDIAATEQDFVKRMEQKEQQQHASDAATVAVENKQRNVTEDYEDEEDSADEQQQQQAKKKKKKKKRKKKKAGTSVDGSAPSTPQPQQPPGGSVVSDDPLIGALLGMGFEYDQVMDGIEGCGGMSRATADDVVAWIFRQSEEEQPPSAASSSAQASVTQPKGGSAGGGGGVTISQAESERLNAIKVQEDRMAAEKLAAKREEQRRRNREWNNRAQVRQAMEAQGKVAAAARTTTLRTGTGVAPTQQQSHPVAGSSAHQHHRSGVGSAHPAVSPLALGAGAKQLMPGDVQIARKPPQQTTAAAAASPTTSGSRLVGGVHVPTTTKQHHSTMIPSESAGGGGPDTNVYSNNEASTVASSLEHFEVEVGGNDDATVSTMGSFPAVPVPAPSLPPGFSSSGTHGEHPSALHGQQWESHRPPLPTGSHPLPHLPPPAAMGSLIAPPGIPESGPLLDRADLGHGAQRSQSFSVPSMPNHRMPAQRSFSGSVYPDSSTGGGMLGSALPSSNNDPLAGGLGGSFLSDSFGSGDGLGVAMERNHHHHSAPPAPGFSASLPLSSAGVPGLMGFGNDLVGQSSPHLESAIIDSISTGNTAIGTSTLWNETPAGSSLLGSLIDSTSNNNSNNRNATGGGMRSETSGTPLFASSSSFNSNDNNSGNNAHPTWHPDRVLQQKPGGGAGGNGSIW